MKHALTLCFALIQVIVFSQKIYVYDSPTGAPIAKASIKLYTDNSENKEFFTNADGSTPIPSEWKKVVISISAPGYKSITKSRLDWSWNKLNVSLVPNGIDILTFEILSTRISAPSKTLPMDVINLNNSFLNNPLNMADALEKSGDVFVQRSQLGGGSPVLRGMEANRILLVIDGVRLNTPIYRSGHLQNILRLDPNVSSDVEVINGSASPFYGSDAIGGVISVSTILPQFAEISKKVSVKGGTQIRLSSGNFQYWNQEQSAHAWVNFGFKKLAVRTSLTFNAFGDLRQGANGIEPSWKNTMYSQRFENRDSAVVNNDPLLQKRSGYEQLDLNQRWIYITTKSTQHHLSFQFTNSTNVNRYDMLTELDSNNLPAYGDWYYGPEQRALISYQLKLNKETKFYNESKIIAAWQLNKESRNTRKFQSSTLNSRFEEVKSYSLNADFKKLIASSSIYYGAEFYSHEINSTANSTNIKTGEMAPISTRYPAGGSTVNNASIYLTMQQQLLTDNKLIATGGIRYTFNELKANFGGQTFYPFPFKDANQTNNVVCGQLGLVFNYVKLARFKLLWSQGFRSPNVDDMGKVFDSSPGLLIIPNPNLKAERSNSYEFSFLLKPEANFNIELVAFATLLSDAIVNRPSNFSGLDSVIYDGTVSAVYSNMNADQAQIFGGSFRLNWKINSKTFLKVNSTFTYGAAISNSVKAPQDHIPPMFGKFQLNRKFNDKFASSFWLLYNTAKTLNRYSLSGEDNLQFATPMGMPAWQTFNVSLKYNFSKLSFCELNLENLFDKNYRTFASGISAPGRLIRLTISTRF